MNLSIRVSLHHIFVAAPCPIADNQRKVLDGLTPDVVNTLSKLAKLMNCSTAVEATTSDDMLRTKPEALADVVAQIIRVRARSVDISK